MSNSTAIWSTVIWDKVPSDKSPWGPASDAVFAPTVDEKRMPADWSVPDVLGTISVPVEVHEGTVETGVIGLIRVKLSG